MPVHTCSLSLCASSTLVQARHDEHYHVVCDSASSIRLVTCICVYRLTVFSADR